jgi:PadR family transcriptional regulator, regulatory protein AphA
MSLPHAILGLLHYMPMTGYDLKNFFNDSIGFFWSAQMSQIYRELKNLEKKEYVSSKDEINAKGPNKRIYSVTEQGMSHLKEWLADVPEKIDEDNRNAFLLRVMLLSNLGAEELYFQIQHRLKKYKKDLNALQSVEKKLQHYLVLIGKTDMLIYWKITLNRGFHDVSSHIAWAEESLHELKKVIGNKKK